MGKVGISFAIGGSIAAVIMVIGMITLLDTETSTTSTLGLQGHYTVKITDADGFVKAYMQTKNAPTHLLKDCLFDSYFGTSVATTSCDITTPTLRVGDGLNGGGTADTDGSMGNEYTASGTGNAVVNTTTDPATSSSISETTVTFDNKADVIIISQTDLDNSGTGRPAPTDTDGPCVDEDADTFDECEIDEVGFFTTAGAMLSHATLAKTLVGAGDQVDIELLLTQSGG